MADYYTLETVRDQILQMGGTIAPNHIPRNFPSDWQYCPCVIKQACIKYDKVICHPPILVGVYIRPPRRGIPIIIEVVYERSTHRGFIRANNMKLNELIGKGKINQAALTRVTRSFG
jgi:hypothetical protein